MVCIMLLEDLSESRFDSPRLHEFDAYVERKQFIVERFAQAFDGEFSSAIW